MDADADQEQLVILCSKDSCFREDYGSSQSKTAEPGPMSQSSRKADFHSQGELPIVKAGVSAGLGGGCI